MFTLETPGLGGYYAERSRYFFKEPHPEIQEHFNEALKLQEFQVNAYKNGMTMQQLRDVLNQHKASVGAQGNARTHMDGYGIRGIKHYTCRPLINCEWEMFRAGKGNGF